MGGSKNMSILVALVTSTNLWIKSPRFNGYDALLWLEEVDE